MSIRDPFGIMARQRAFERSLDRSVRLRREGRMREAKSQLRLASRLADESMEHSLHLIRGLVSRLESLCRKWEEGERPGEGEGSL